MSSDNREKNLVDNILLVHIWNVAFAVVMLQESHGTVVQNIINMYGDAAKV